MLVGMTAPRIIFTLAACIALRGAWCNGMAESSCSLRISTRFCRELVPSCFSSIKGVLDTFLVKTPEIRTQSGHLSLVRKVSAFRGSTVCHTDIHSASVVCGVRHAGLAMALRHCGMDW